MAQNLAPLESLRTIRHTQWLVTTPQTSRRVENTPDVVEIAELVYGVWHGTQMHICTDGYCETVTFGYGDELRCARCEEFYDPARDDTL